MKLRHMMAEAYAKSKSNRCDCVTAGPGATNALPVMQHCR